MKKNCIINLLAAFLSTFACLKISSAEQTEYVAKDPITLKVTSHYYAPDNAQVNSLSALKSTRNLANTDGSSVLAHELVQQEGYTLQPDSKFFPLPTVSSGTKDADRFEQRISGIPVYGSQVVINENNNGKIQSAVFKITEALPRTFVPSITAKEVAQFVLANYSDKIAASLKVSEPKLVIFDPYLAGQVNVSAAVLGWRATVKSDNGEVSDDVIIDAASGNVMHSSTYIHNLHREILDCSFGSPCLLDSFSSSENYYYGRSEGMPVRGPHPQGSNPFFHGYPQQVDELYDLIADVTNYYQTTFSRNGADGSGGIGTGANISNTHAAMYTNNSAGVYSATCPNAFFDSTAYAPGLNGYMAVCAGLATNDIIGHEYTHAVTFHSVPGDLTYQGESGALNEGVSDIFGEAVQRFLTGSSDWISGGTTTLFPGGLRNLVDPESAHYPATMYSANFYCGTDDHGGVHTNSSVFGRVAALLAIGGTNNGCTITSIGADKEEAIFYRALTHYFTSSSTFHDAYNALVSACFDLYGASSVECRETGKAINAGMLNQPGTCSVVSAVTPDCDNCPLDAAKAEPAVCGCGVAETNTDGDSAPDCIDQCPNDPAKIAVGTCGCGVSEADLNNDLINDCGGAVKSFAKSIIPRFGKVVGAKHKISFVLEKVLGKGISYEVVVTGPKKFKTTINSKSNKITLKNLANKGTYKFKYRIAQAQKNGKKIFSKYSANTSVAVL
jgi:bacillolysin